MWRAIARGSPPGYVDEPRAELRRRLRFLSTFVDVSIRKLYSALRIIE